MRTIGKAIVVLTLAMATSHVAEARDARSSARQPDFSSCSSARHACVVGTARRGHAQGGCERAYRTCMRTGHWDTYGPLYGRRMSGLARH